MSPKVVREQEIESINATPWSRRVAVWSIDLVIAVVVSSVVGWSAASLLDWPGVIGWIVAVVLAFSYWPLMSLFKRTPGQVIMGVRPMYAAVRPLTGRRESGSPGD